MAELFGLSHLIFSSPAGRLREGSPLAALLTPPETYRFDHSEAKRGLVALPGATTALALYNSADGTLPALELIQTGSQNRASLESYGLILPALDGPEASCATADALLGPGPLRFVDELPSYAAIRPELLAKHSCAMGAWKLTRYLAAAERFLKNIAGARKMPSPDGTAHYVCRVVNRKFSNFLWAVAESPLAPERHYNDSVGLACAGWFARDLGALATAAAAAGFQTTPEFDIDMNGRSFRAAFVHDGLFMSHEALTVKQP